LKSFFNHSTADPLSSANFFPNGYDFSSLPLVEDNYISFSNNLTLSLIPLSDCVVVYVPLIPDVALVELPPHYALLSKSKTLPPF